MIETSTATKLTPIVLRESSELEALILGILLYDGRALTSVLARGLTADDFFIIAHQWTFQAMLDLRNRDIGVDEATVAEELKKREQLEDCGGWIELNRMVNDSFGHAFLMEYVDAVRKTGERRRILQAHIEGINAEQNGLEIDPLELWQQSITRLEAVRPYTETDTILRGRDSVAYYDQQIAEESANPLWYGVPWSALEEYAPVHKPGDIWVIAGPTGSGKSAMASNAAEYYASQEQAKVFYAFAEMDKNNVLARRTVAHSKLPYHKLLRPDQMTADEQAARHRADEGIAEWVSRVDYWECGAIRARDLVARLKDEVERHHVQVIVLDALNKIRFEPAKGHTTADAIYAFMAYLETFARENKVLIIITVQLNRDNQIYGSAAFEHTAALVISLKGEIAQTDESVLFENTEYRVFSGKGAIYRKATITKNRRGECGSFELVFIGARFLWIDRPYQKTLTEIINAPLDLGDGY